jgi:GT2 family glycosyltransferase
VSHTERSPFVSVIVVNWNGKWLLASCLQNLMEQTYVHREIILVDNGSDDGSVEMARRLFPRINIVQLPWNKGFTGGNIAGFQASKGDFVMLLNNDARPDPYCLERLVEAMVRDQHVGICASKLVYEAHTSGVNSAGHGMTTAGVGFDRGTGRPLDQFSRSELVFGACAAAALYRRSMLDQIGFFDDDFFIYDEDADLNARAQLAGWKCRFVPDALTHHVGHATSGWLSDWHVYYHTRNLEFVWLKNMPTGLMLRYAHHKIAHEIGAFVYLCLRHRRWRPYFSAKRDALRMLPGMLKKRRVIQAGRMTTNADLRRMLTPVFQPGWFLQKVRQLVTG